MYEKECIFCGKKDKYKKGIKEGLTQAKELSVNDSVRKAAIIKQDSRILAIHVIWLQPKVTTIALVTGTNKGI